MFIIQHNDGRVHTTDVKAEARLYAWLSMEFILCNVYRQGGACVNLFPFEI